MPLITTRANASARGFGFEISAATADTGVMFPLQVVTVGAAGASSVSFTNIPSTYNHLQIRVQARTTASGGQDLNMEINGDTTVSNYRLHRIYGSGSTAYADTYNLKMVMTVVGTSFTSSSFSEAVIDILDYTSTNKNKTTRILYGFDGNNTSGEIGFVSSLYFATPAAITSLDFKIASGNFAEYSHFALYGIKGA